MSGRPAEADVAMSARTSHRGVAGEPDNLRDADAANGIDLPVNPILTIEAARGWPSLDLRDLWAHRDLFYFMVWRDIKVRYKQTALGVAWAVIQPVATMVLFTIVFGRIAHLPSDGVPYPLFTFAGLLPWQLFAASLQGSAN